METKNKYIHAGDLEVYKLARQMSSIAWKMYEGFDWQIKKINGDQFIEATDSVGANIIEGYGRFHYLDRIKFYYNARASFFECSIHWLDILHERKQIEEAAYNEFRTIAEKFSIKLNNFISATYRSKDNKFQ